VPGCRDVVIHGVNGLLVEARNAAALAEAIATLIADPVLRRQMGAAGRRIAEQRFSQGQIAGDTLAVYRKAGLKGLSV
jgi:glycosyltransferase involved in cell wall biosynthesis